MQRLLTVAALLAAAASARAHFVWILPPEKEGQPARVIFSDNLQPDRPELLKKVAGTDVFARGEDGKTAPLGRGEGKEFFPVPLPDGRARVLGGVCHYGVSEHGKGGPFLLTYYAKAYLPPAATDDRAGALRTQAWDKLPFEILPADIGRDRHLLGAGLLVLWRGKPLADAEVTIVTPVGESGVLGKTDAAGTVALPVGGLNKSGTYGFRVIHEEPGAGELAGKKYNRVKHVATLTLPGHDGSVAVRPAPVGAPEKSEDPAATKLLADARAARANWENFPGFTADLEVNVDGKVARGTAVVDPKGIVTVQVSDPAASTRAKRMLGSIVAHRLDDSGDLHTPCAFADDVTDHPLGRAIRVLNDEFHSGYRIRDRQVIEVNRVMKDTRFTITVIENHLDADGHYLPVSYVVNYWDRKSGALERSEAHHQTWQHVGRYDLPATATVVAAPGKGDEAAAGTANRSDVAVHHAVTPPRQETLELRLTNVRLAGGGR
jgi:hypothetical protein